VLTADAPDTDRFTTLETSLSLSELTPRITLLVSKYVPSTLADPVSTPLESPSH
jgi:hypothetical protein